MGMMIFLVLMLFHPFGLNQIIGSKKYLIEFGFGFITFAIMTINSKFLPKLFPAIFCEENWTIYKEILFTLFSITIISIANVIYLYMIGFIRLSVPFIVLSIFYTLLVAVFPVFLLTILKYNKILRTNLKDADEINFAIDESEKSQLSDDIFNFQGLSENDKITIPSDTILYIQSQRNYLQFFYTKDGKCKSKLIRATMKELEESTNSFEHLQRCHRSFIVNINCISKIDGDSLGYNLHLDNCENQIPVSRSYTKIFKQRFF